MRTKKLLFTALITALPLAGLVAPGCSTGPTGTLCAKICDCQHCSDFAEKETCDATSYAKKVAHDYACDAPLDAFVLCEIDKGVCDERHASFGTHKLGSCSTLKNTALPCANAGDCKLAPGSDCTNGTCQIKTCADGSGNVCKTDDDCPNGEDFCKAEITALGDCVTKASKDPSLLAFFGLPQQQQPPGGSGGAGGN